MTDFLSHQHDPQQANSQASRLAKSKAKGMDDLLDFDDAFDPFLLKRFYQEPESTNSQSNFSPRKTSSMTEEFLFGDFDTKDFSASPFPQKNPRAISEGIHRTENSPSFGFDENWLEPKELLVPMRSQSHFVQSNLATDNFFNFQQPIQPPSYGQSGMGPDRTFSLLTRALSQSTIPSSQQQSTYSSQNYYGESIKEQAYQPNLIAPISEEDKKFQRLLKDKKIFKIQRPTMSAHQVVKNLKEKAEKASKGQETSEKVKIEPLKKGNSVISFNLKLTNNQAKVSNQTTGNCFEFKKNKGVQDLFSESD